MAESPLSTPRTGRHRPSGSGSNADVVVIGGGVIGAAVLFELARRGIRATLIERSRLGQESTGKSAAIVRMHYSNAVVVRMALRSRQLLQDFTDLTGADSVYFEIGWTFLVPEDRRQIVQETVEMMRREGVTVEELDADGTSELFPGIVWSGIGAVFFEPESGFADPYATTHGLAAAAVGLGAQIREGVQAERLVVDKGRLVAVDTNEGRVACDTVVLAAGPWSASLAASAGVELPLMITREEELYVELPADQKPRAVTSDLVDCIYLRPLLEWNQRPEALLLGRGFPKPYDEVSPESYDEQPSQAFDRDVRERLGRRLPHLRDAKILGGVVGLYAATPDWHPYLGRVDSVQGLVLATGGSGHCFKLAPAIAEMVVGDLANERVDYADIDLFNLRRLETGELFQSAVGGNRA